MFKLQPISFCDKMVKNVVSESDKEIIINTMADNFQLQITNRDCIILRDDFAQNLKRNIHYVSILSTGNRYFLYLMKYQEHCLTLFIDRKIKEGYNMPRILQVDYQFHPDLYEQNTLFGGELVKKNMLRSADGKTNHMFVINDLYVYKNRRTNMNIINKFEIIHDILTNKYIANEDDEPCEIKVKKIFECNQTSTLIDNYIKMLPYPCKGLVFHPDNKKHKTMLHLFKHSNANKTRTNNDVKNNIKDNNKNDNNIKDDSKKDKVMNVDTNIKTSTCPSDLTTSLEEHIKNINFAMKNTKNKNIKIKFNICNTLEPDIYKLYINYKDELVEYGYAHISNLKCSKYVSNLFNNNTDNVSITIECSFSKNFNKWCPIFDTAINETTTETIENILKLVN
jgi:hypothetical protein